MSYRIGLGLAVALLTTPTSQLLGQCGNAIRWSNIHERIHIRHNLNTSKEVAQPAFFQIVRPFGGDPVASVNAGVRVDACATPLLTTGLFSEYLWNTATDKRQNTVRAGVDAEWQVREISSAAHTNSPLLLIQANYKNDNEKKNESAQAVVTYTHVFRNEPWPAPNATWRPSEVLDITYAPFIGVVAEQVFRAQDPTREGTILRGVFQLDANLYPLGVRLDRRVELNGSYAYRYDITDGTSEADDHHPYFRGALNVFFFRDENKSAGASLAYIDGEDPTRGFEDQRLWQLGFTLRIK